MNGIIFILAIILASCAYYLLVAYKHIKTYQDAELFSLIIIVLGSTLIALGYAICKISINQ